MTNKKYFETCTKEELAETLTYMIVSAVEQVIQKSVSVKAMNAEYNSLLQFLDEEFIEPSKYLN